MDPHSIIVEAHKDLVWRRFVHMLWDEGLLPYTHPNHQPSHQAVFVMEEPLLNIGTAAYDDIDVFLRHVFNMHINGMGHKWAMVVGGQQSYSRMVWSKYHNPGELKYLIPLPGEFHFCVHCLMAIHILWYETLAHGFIQALEANTEANFNKTIKKSWNNVKEWHHYDQFYTHIICAMLVHFKDVLGTQVATMANHSTMN